MRFSTRPGEAPAQHGRRGLRELAVWVWVLGFCLAALVATYVMFVEAPTATQAGHRERRKRWSVLPLRPGIC